MIGWYLVLLVVKINSQKVFELSVKEKIEQEKKKSNQKKSQYFFLFL